MAPVRRWVSPGWSTWPSPAPPSATATIGESFSFTVRTTGVPRTFTVSPKPPSGLRFKNLGNGTATLSGTPGPRLATGKYRLVFEAIFGTKKSPEVVSQAFTLTLVP